MAAWREKPRVWWHMEVSDDYVTQFECPNLAAALNMAKDIAKSHGGQPSYLYPGKVRSGVEAVACVAPDGKLVWWQS